MEVSSSCPAARRARRAASPATVQALCHARQEDADGCTRIPATPPSLHPHPPSPPLPFRLHLSAICSFPSKVPSLSAILQSYFAPHSARPSLPSWSRRLQNRDCVINVSSRQSILLFFFSFTLITCHLEAFWKCRNTNLKKRQTH